MRFPLLGLARDLHPLANAHAERTAGGDYTFFGVAPSFLYDCTGYMIMKAMV